MKNILVLCSLYRNAGEGRDGGRHVWDGKELSYDREKWSSTRSHRNIDGPGGTSEKRFLLSALSPKKKTRFVCT